MDTSKEYIKMCDCPEIPEGHEWEAGDFGCWPENGDINVMYCGEYMPSELGEGHVWLPRQDQLQDMVELDPLKEYIIKQSFLGYSYVYLLIWEIPFGEGVVQGDTFEQLWLAFYMSQKHNKTWDGEEWKRI